MALRSVTFVICLIASAINYGNSSVSPDLLCTREYCENIVSENPCPEVKEHCIAQNDTHSGIWMPSTDFCNCCVYCLVHLKENDECTPGGLGASAPDSLCGPGLSCTAVGDRHECRRMESPCHEEQDKFQNNPRRGVFQEKRRCDDRGDYGPTHCIVGQSCYCFNKLGKRIFGEAVNEDQIKYEMNCACARVADTAETMLNSKRTHSSRCMPDGSYDPLQCIGNRCFCVFQDTGVLSSPTIIDLDTQSLELLPCVDPDRHYRDYFKPCETEKLEWIKVMQEYERDGFTYLGDPLPNCEADGGFHPVQIRDNRKICVDSHGVQIKHYGGGISDNIHCKCARTELLLEKTRPSDVPQCMSDGSWNPTQFRQGIMYRVDEDGFQIS